MEVFSSRIERPDNEVQNDLYEILRNTPHEPIKPANKSFSQSDFPEFKHRTDKCLAPTKSSRLKVRTIRDIRREYEKYVYTYLKDDLEKQESQLFKKIESGLSKEDGTIHVAKKILETDEPKSRATWLMITKLNPKNNRFSSQYALWNGKKIKLSGSIGGPQRFKWNFDLHLNHKYGRKVVKYQKYNSLLKSSLKSNFKPGPLSKKLILDRSYQKVAIGESNLVYLPNIRLEIKPTYEITLDPIIFNYIPDLNDPKDKLTENWANFAVSAIGSLHDGFAVQDTNNQFFKFDLKFKNGQKRLLVRHSKENTLCTTENSTTDDFFDKGDNSLIATIVDDLIRATEISIDQDKIILEEEELKDDFHNDAFYRDKCKRKKSELQRLDVTVINLSGCQNSFCALGCICNSLQYKRVKSHCGRIACMFKCTCSFKKSTMNNFLSDSQNEQLSNLLNIQGNIASGLAKEEEKFHQTVIVTEEKSILFKSRKRKSKKSNRYSDLNNSLCVQHDFNEKDLCINLLKLNCDNVQPWCIVHNLYNCFCKGTIVESFLYKETIQEMPLLSEELDTLNDASTVSAHYEDINSGAPIVNTESLQIKSYATRNRNKRESSASTHYEEINSVTPIVNTEPPDKKSYATRNRNRRESITRNRNKRESSASAHYDDINSGTLIVNTEPLDTNSSAARNRNRRISVTSEINISREITSEIDEYATSSKYDYITKSCARTKPYTKRRRFNDLHYYTRNLKIFDMERNDKSLQNRLQVCFDKSTIPEVTSVENVDVAKLLKPDNPVAKDESKLLKNKSALVSWLETHYKHHKQKLQSGSKITLEAPKEGKFALYPWEVILERYREKKNFFFISKKEPHRIFIAISKKFNFLTNCMNIDEIRYSDLHNYPPTIKNLLTNAVNVKDNFYILRGQKSCWELYGSVTKSKENDSKNINDVSTSNNCENVPMVLGTKDYYFENKTGTTINNELDTTFNNEGNSDGTETSSKTNVSKWFFMTLENDFDELRFDEKGFMVKYESIINAIKIAREEKKTVRLSRVSGTEEHSNPQFGIYALADINKSCVFVGPYEIDEELGMETKKGNRHYASPNQTRGSWVITEKMNNARVLENPLIFLPNVNKAFSKKYKTADTINLPNTINVPETKDTEYDTEPVEIQTNILSPSKSSLKLVKPIKIRKTDGFYQLEPNGHLKQVSLLKSSTATAISKNESNNTKCNKIYVNKTLQKAVSPTLVQFNLQDIKAAPGRGMSILKPEEINHRALYKAKTQNIHSGKGDDLEHFLKVNKIMKCAKRNDDAIVIISDDEECDNYMNFEADNWQDVVIECTNVDNLGCLKGMKNAKNQLSFQFPGFKFTDFYDENHVFSKINQVLARKVFVPENLKLEWRVAQPEFGKRILKESDFVPDSIMTTSGICPRAVYTENQELFRTAFKELHASVFCDMNVETKTTVLDMNIKSLDVIQELQKKDEALQRDIAMLREDLSTKKRKILESMDFMPENMQVLVKNNLEIMDS